jgi:hypothetical protein
MRLQAGSRCKIVKTMKFLAKSSRERSYAQILPLPAASGWKAGKFREGDWKKDFWDHCAIKGENNLQAPAVLRVRFADGIPGNQWG